MTRFLVALFVATGGAACAPLIGADFSDKTLCKDPCRLDLTPTTPPTFLATGQDAPEAIAADASGVYWVTGDRNGSQFGKVFKCASTGCGLNPVLLASGQENSKSIALDGANVYWTNAAGTVMRCATGGCDREPLIIASEQDRPLAVAVDATRVYWANGGNAISGQIASCPIEGCTAPTILAELESGPEKLVVAGGHVFWANYASEILTCPVDGCDGAPTVFATSQENVGGMVADATHVYWTTSSDVGQGSVFGQVVKCALEGCDDDPTVLVTGRHSPAGVALDATRVYYTDWGDPGVYACELDGCDNEPTTIAARVDPDPAPEGLKNPIAIAVDAENVYWTSRSEGIVAKHSK